MTDRHRHDGPSQRFRFKTLRILKLCTENRLSELRNEMAERTVTSTTDCHRHDGPSQMFRSMTLRILKFGTENRLSKLRNELAGRTVTGSHFKTLRNSEIWY